MKDYKHWRAFDADLSVLIKDPAFLKFCIKSVKELRKEVRDIEQIDGELIKGTNKLVLTLLIKEKGRMQI